MTFAEINRQRVRALAFRERSACAGATHRTCLPSLRRAALCTAFTWASLAAGAAMADATPDANSEAPEAGLKTQPPETEPSSTFWNREQMFGDIGGLRPWLGEYGVTFTLTETSEVLANLRGGLARGADYDGVTTATVQMDTHKAFGVPGGLFNVSALQIHGANLSANKLGTLNTASG
ncbi:carbohydrate porin, partial [Paraburkholderia sp.]|uniref:carbohydrate porin n=1 Tax=Paraburkholderia sp. TaxID=1926495 RepID=UPI002F6C554B